MRPGSHVQETKSRQALERALPAEWVARAQTPDYGIDYEVEVFKEQKTTPWRFSIQLKSSEGVAEGSPSLAFPTERLRQYVEMGSPVMLALYDSHRDRLWFDWAHRIWRCLSRSDTARWRQQESFTIAFSRRLDGMSREALEAEVRRESLRLGRPLPADHIFTVRLACTGGSILTSAVAAHVARVGSAKQVRFETRPDVDAFVDLDTELGVLSFGVAGEQPLEIPEAGKLLGENEAERSGSLLIALSFALASAGLRQVALDLASHLLDEGVPRGVIGTVLLGSPSLAALFANEGRTREALQLASQLRLGKTDADHVTGLMLATAALHPGRRHGKGYRLVLESALVATKSAHRRAPLFYSIANSLRTDGEFVDAIKRYRAAAAEDPEYRLRSYWWAELAGCLFELRRFKFAEQAYRIAALLGERRLPVQGLLGDTLLRRGRLREALSELDAYLVAGAPLFAGLVVARAVAGVLRASFGDLAQRNVAQARDVVAAVSAGEPSVELFEQAVRADPLNPAAWFNLASALRKNGRLSAWAAIVAAYVLPRDREAWALAVVEVTRLADEYVAVAVVVEGYRRFGGELEAGIRQVIAPAQVASQVVDALRKLEAQYRAYFVTEDWVETRLLRYDTTP